ncbi:MAG: FGGY-family carbohydrate kinase, partial [Chthoniobacterales bacterium]
VHQRPRLVRTDGELPFGLFRYVVDEERTVLGGATSNAGNLHRWCLRELRLNARALEKQLFSCRDTAAYDELVVLPFWVQERAPTWPEDLRGTVVGLSQTTTAAEILRAATTATFYRLRDILELFETSTGDALRVIVSGGAANSSATLRLLADCLGRDIEKSAELEASLSGAAIYALERLGAKPARRRRGRFVRHIPALSAKHQERRTRQVELEELLSSDLPLARRLFRRAD